MRLADILNNRVCRLIQVLKLLTITQTPRDLLITERRLSPYITQLPNAVRSLNTRLSKSTARPLHGLLIPSTGRMQHRPGFRDTYDGFVGPELQLTSTKRPSRRRKTNQIMRQKPGTMRELALGAGFLPVFAERDMVISAVLAVDKTTTPHGWPTLSRPGDTQSISKIGQLVLTRTQSALQANVVVEGVLN